MMDHVDTIELTCSDMRALALIEKGAIPIDVRASADLSGASPGMYVRYVDTAGNPVSDAFQITGLMPLAIGTTGLVVMGLIPRTSTRDGDDALGTHEIGEPDLEQEVHFTPLPWEEEDLIASGEVMEPLDWPEIDELLARCDQR